MNTSLPHWRLPLCLVLAGLSLFLSAAWTSAASPEAAERSHADRGNEDVVGQPMSLQVQPESIALRGRHAHQQLVVTGHYADGLVRDLT
ncbi:MAG TPA: hypothetical protein VMF69_26710, partial [Gemmataceae bacterium]|nr:hypothetical protein [Gemmataceae bacterium]